MPNMHLRRIFQVEDLNNSIILMLDNLSSRSVVSKLSLAMAAAFVPLSLHAKHQVKSNHVQPKWPAEAKSVDEAKAIGKATAIVEVPPIKENKQSVEEKPVPGVVLHSESQKIDSPIRDVPEKPNFWGDQWSLGYGLIMPAKPYINDASVVNGVVRVGDSQRMQNLAILFRHWYFSEGGICTVSLKGECQGIHFSAAISDKQSVSMLGIGWSIGFGRKTSDPQNQEHNLNIGIGRVFGVKTLGDGISENTPLPVNENQIRYKNRDATAVYIGYSYSVDSKR